MTPEPEQHSVGRLRAGWRRRRAERPNLRALTGVESDPIAPLWRASQAFRLVTLAYAVTYQVSSVPNYSNAKLSWAIVGVMAIWSGVSAVALTHATVPRWWVVLADQFVIAAIMIATRAVSEHDWYTANQTIATTLWAANAVLSAAILCGPWIGVLSGLGIALVSLSVKEAINSEVWRDATIPMLVSAGLAIGLASSTATRAHAQLERAVRLAAATEERERLAREVHDGVLQVLAYVQRRGTEIGGPAAELAQKAGEQEVALRVLISEQGAGASSDAGGGAVDLRPLLRTQARTSVSISAPGDPVLVSRHIGTELAAAVATALSNVELHAGPRAKAFVLVEDVGDDVIVSVRDDGSGIAPGRLDEAEAEGRLGVSRSIRGRIEGLGGTADLFTEPGGGTEWEFRVPRGRESR
ncbi:MacS family sensor histidine kinase [Antrihabitans stalactiti]|uniref:ATP-binding protein n=1 Tax=Antrihabitans stalactiti TaxID=2584121 RepID=A0A848KA41_9NOCA|nr:ATP-binding protein [Antrihabitans stalactiti]